MKKLLALMIAALTVGSCLSDPEPGAFCAPEIVAAHSAVERNVVVLSCEVSGKSGIKECGFLFGTDEEALGRNICGWSGDGEFSMSVEGLTFDVDYYWRPFISSGRDERCTDVKHFKIQQRLPEISLTAVTDRTSSSAVVEYTVGENFSGELVVCGLCWGTESGPDIESSWKTFDSARYGEHKTRITGLTVGQTYYIRAYAINAKGTAYSGELRFYAPVTFGDSTISEYMLGIADADGDGYLSLEEAENIRRVELCSDAVESLSGIEKCISISRLVCRGSGSRLGKLKEVDLSRLKELEELDLSGNVLTEVDLSANAALRNLALDGNMLSSVKLPESSALESIRLEDNRLTDAQFTGFPHLAELSLSSNSLSSAELDGLGSLKTLDISDNPLTELQLLQTSGLEELDLSGTQLPGYTDLFKKVRGLKRLKIKNVLHDDDKVYILPALEELDCSGSGITAINLRFNRALRKAVLQDCRELQSLDICPNDNLESLDCRGCTSLGTIYMVEDQKIDGINAGLPQELMRPSSAEVVYSSRISDPVFLKFLTDTFDRDYDGFVCITEVENAEEVTVDASAYSGIASLHGIEMFRSLKKLSVPGQKISSLDLCANAQLTDLNCDSNPLKELRIGKCTALVNLFCQGAGLQEIDLSGCPQLSAVHLFNNSLRSLDLSANPNVRTLDCSSNRLEGVLDLSGCTALRRLDCSGNPALSKVIVSGSQVEIVKDEGCTVVPE